MELVSNNTRDKHTEGRWAKQRFYKVSAGGKSTLYFDSVTGDQKLDYGHILGQLIRRGNDYNTAQEIIKNTHFDSIILSPVYKPHQREVVTVDGNLYPNVWKRPAVIAQDRDPTPFREHLSKMMGSDDKAQYLIRMLAYRYQVHDIKAKPHVAFYLYGLVGGYGKSLLASTLDKVFGSSAVTSVPDQTALESMSAIDMWTRTWCVVQEVDVKKGSTNMNKLKTFTGGDSFSAARKGEHFKVHDTPAQLLMLSNDAPHFLEPNDRRFFVSQWQCEFADAAEKNAYFNTYVSWLNSGGYEAIAWLLNTTDISSVDVAAPAMMTKEKRQVMELAVDECAQDIREIVEASPANVLWTLEHFEAVLMKHQVENNAAKYKLEAAGLTKQSRVTVGKAKQCFWCSAGAYIKSGSGIKASVTTPQGSYLLRDAIKRIPEAGDRL